MSTNKDLIARAFEGLAAGDGAALVGMMADDVVWTVTGTTAWSGVLRGKGEVITKLLMPLGAQLANRPTVIPRRLIAEGDLVVVEANGRNTTHTGKDYSNTYCFVIRLAEGQIREVTEYLDTALLASALAAPGAAV